MREQEKQHTSGSWRVPDRPQPPQIVRASCASVTLSWAPPDAHGWSIDEYRVWTARDGLPAIIEEEQLHETRAELTGLLAGTLYEFRVQARGL